jgi:hypothetical protein
VALILTLGILVLVTMLVIAFAVSMRVENTASKNFNDYYKARELAKAATDQAVATLRQATPLRTQSGTPAAFTTYVTFPGVIYTNFFDGTAKNIGSFTLYSCPACTPPNTTNLNAGLWITGGTNGFGEFNSNSVPDPSQINVGWVYVAADGSLSPPNVALTKPLVGRFAYWVDDEASKINVNTAGLGAVPADAPYASAQKELDLQMLYPLPNPFLYAAAIQSGGPTYPRATYPYTTIEEIKRADPGITAAYFDDNRFSVTTYSSDGNYPSYADDLDVFDRQRMIISSLNSPNDLTAGSRGAYDRLADPALMQVCSAGGVLRAFEQKYTVNGLKQIIANIMGYQINNLTLKWPPDDGSAIPAAPAFLGLAKTPYISEVQVKYVFTGTAPDLQIMRTVTVKLYYMYTDGTFISRPGDKVTVSGLPTPGSGFSDTVTVDMSGGGTYSTTRTCYYASTTDGPATYSSSVGQVTLPGKPINATYIRRYVIGGDHRLDYAAMTLPLQNSVAIPGTYYQDSELTGDPAVNELPSQWTVHKDGDGARLTTCPPSTADTKAVMRAGPMQSIGELGYIHHPTLPFTHLTLQPGVGGGQIPDWAMLDLFTVDPAVVPKVTMGRININSFINPGLATAAPNTKRLVPLKALLSGLTPPPPAVDIYDDPKAVRGGGADNYGMKDPTTGDPIFDTIGEVCEITSLVNGGANEAAKEATIRRIANLITVRSTTFTIWVMAQSIKQPPGSTFGTYNPNVDLITGEVRAQAVVERYETSPGNPGNAVKFRVRYFRYL